MNTNKDKYFVAVKVFLENNKGQFLIIKDIFGDGWDLPGGRLRTNEFKTPLENVVKRKIKEELGGKVKYKLGKSVVFFRHERTELPPEGHGEKVRIFAIGYKAKYISGNITTSPYIKNFAWVNKKTFKPEKYFKGGWLKGVKEYLKIK